MTQLKIDYRAIDALIPYARNAKHHSSAQVAQIAASIREFGWGSPILVDGKNHVIAGHGRLMAARQLAMTEVPVVALEHLTDTQRRALILADNKIGENASWEDELLKLELTELQDAGLALELTGFSAEEWESLVAGSETTQDGQCDEDELPETTQEATAKHGDLWVLGNHKLLCGDATNLDDYRKLLGNERVDMTFTDPPYNVNYANKFTDKVLGRDRPILNDNLGEDFHEFLRLACTNIIAHTNGAIYIAMAGSELDTLQSAFRASGGRWSSFIIWAKQKFSLGRSDYQRQYEPILYGWKEGNEHFWCGARDQSDIWHVKRADKNDLHPTMKPVRLVERAIRNSSKTNDLVLDPFGGSGSTLIACEKSGRRCRMIEQDPKYVDVIVKRWARYTGNTEPHPIN